MIRKSKSAGSSAPLREFFETSDDGLAAFLRLRGCQYVGFGSGERDEPDPVVTHLFDDEAMKLYSLRSAYLHRQDDEVSASAFEVERDRLRRARIDLELVLRRQVVSDLAKVRGGER